MKRVQPYIKRADELEEEEPLASFYCRTYVVEQLLALKDASVQIVALEQLDKAEQTKKIHLGEDINSSGQGPHRFQQFCSTVYDAADEALTAASGDAADTTELAMRFYFAALFYDVLTQFGQLSSDDEARRARARRLVVEIKRGNFPNERKLLTDAVTALDRNDKIAAVQNLREALRLLEA